MSIYILIWVNGMDAKKSDKTVAEMRQFFCEPIEIG